MLHSPVLFADLAAAGLSHWEGPVRKLLARNLRPGAHGRLAGWQETLQDLPNITTDSTFLDEAAVRVSARECDPETQQRLRTMLLKLVPWRKGPFDLCGTYIDSEWRSDLKWARIVPGISPLQQRLVLDVGCGNGYYALRMSGMGARMVVGIDPTLLFLIQFQAVQRYARQASVHVLPGRLADLPADNHAFDTTFSMGVLYHQRDPLQHLRQLHGTLRPGGELVLETLIVPGDDPVATTPPDRYARMRNVWQLPTLPLLLSWLESSGFGTCRVVERTVTTTAEQRTTEWMPYESLEQALDPVQTTLTVEGLPRPCRAVLVAHART